jgi:hypothetical protein
MYTVKAMNEAKTSAPSTREMEPARAGAAGELPDGWERFDATTGAVTWTGGA